MKGAALRLEVVQSVTAVLQAKPQAVRPMHPTHVGVGDVLIIPEQEWVAGVRIP